MFTLTRALHLTLIISGATLACAGRSDTVVNSNGGSSSITTSSCMPGQTQACLGPGQCAGAQVCTATGSSWGECDCGLVATGGKSSSGGGSPVTSAVIGSGGAPPATGGTASAGADTGGAPSGGMLTGGATPSGGMLTGGATPSGGMLTGGATPSGGMLTGGATTSSAGGGTNTGGETSGGASPTGGAPGTGGIPACAANVTSVGCTAVIPTQTGSLSGQYGWTTVTAGNKQYLIQVNEWGSNAAQNMSYGGNYFFQMTQQQANLTSVGAPAGYPSVFIGANSNHTTSNSGLSRLVSSIGSVLTSWTWAPNGAFSDSNAKFNAAYDVWFSSNGTAEPNASMPSGGFLMIWFHAQGCQPVGTIVDAGRIVEGLPGCWDVWTGNNNGKPVISYKHQGPLLSLGFDLNLFIKDALAHYPNYMKSTWGLTNIFSGFEIWSGGSALESTSFCAEVN